MNPTVHTEPTLERLCIDTVRTLSMDAVQRANSGHPGTPMALAPLAYVLWTRHLRHDPSDPHWIDRDRFILSAGHASMLLYSLLYLTGYDLSLDELKEFRQWGSETPGHPEYGDTPGVETTTGPLGQGVGNSVGFAIAEAHLAALFNRSGHDVIDHHTYFIASDGDLMEGVSHEAASLAGHLQLGKLIGFYDDNHITIDGETELSYTDDAAARFEAYGWHVQRVADGNDLDAIDAAIRAAQDESRPSLIIVRTHIGYGSPNKQDTAEAHGAPLGEDEVRLTKDNLGWPYTEPFTVPDEALAEWRRTKERGRVLHDAWSDRWASYREAYPAEAAELERRMAGRLPDGWDADLPVFDAKSGNTATRSSSGKVLNAIAKRVPELMGGSADLAASNKTLISGSGVYSAGDRAARNLYFGIREHGMASALNGMSLHGGVRPYGATFLIFSDYARPSLRLAALMKRPVIYVFTHDSIGLGEDGPTHQPIETLAALRAIPGFTVMRPADAGETVEAWRTALQHAGPVALALTRQNVPFLGRDRFAGPEGVARGAYILRDSPGGDPQIVLMATGSEVHIAADAQAALEEDGVRVRLVSMPSMERFAAQPADYRDSVLPPDLPLRIAIEAGVAMPWYRWVGDRGRIIALDHFGASAPYERLYEEFGLTADHIVREARNLLR